MSLNVNEEERFSVPKRMRYALSYFKDLIIGDLKQWVKTCFSINLFNNLAFVSQIESKSIKDAENENDEFWILAMQQELNQFQRKKVWELVPLPSNISISGTNRFLEIKLMRKH